MSRNRDVSAVQNNLGVAIPPAAAGKNAVINGDFGIWQRGTTFNNAGAGNFFADRFYAIWDGSGATRNITQQTFTPASAPVAGYEGQYYARYAQTVAGTGGTYSVIVQKIEDVRKFAGQTVTLSFWARVASSTISLTPYLDQAFGSGGSSTVSTAMSTQTITTTWTRFTATASVPSISGKTVGTGSSLNLVLYVPVNTTFTLDLWGFQLEAGSTATPFQTATGTIQGELAACQRYYERTYITSATESAPVGTYSDANYVGGVQWKVVKRSTPTLTVYSTNGGTAGNVRQTSTNTNYAIAGTAGLTVYGVMVLTGVGRSNMVDWHYEVSSEL